MLNEYMGAPYETNDGKLCIVFQHIPDFSGIEARLMITCRSAQGGFNEPKEIFSAYYGNLAYIQNAKIISNGQTSQLYFNAFSSRESQGYWGSAALTGGNAEEIEWMNAPVKLENQHRAWIFPQKIASDKILLAYELIDSSNVNTINFIVQDGSRFRSPKQIATGAQMVRFGLFGNGTWAFVFQRGFAQNMMDYAVFSTDNGQTFTREFPISSQTNVHDPMFLRRTDGDLDLYYIVYKRHGFALYRRQVRSDGRMGSEQQLTFSRNYQKPNPYRLSSGGIIVTLGDVYLSDVGTPVSDLAAITLTSDAP